MFPRKRGKQRQAVGEGGWGSHPGGWSLHARAGWGEEAGAKRERSGVEG